MNFLSISKCFQFYFKKTLVKYFIETIVNTSCKNQISNVAMSSVAAAASVDGVADVLANAHGIVL